MPLIDISNISLPATLKSGSSTQAKKSFKRHTETFSEAYRDKLPSRFLMDLAACYFLSDGKSINNIKEVAQALEYFCEFSFARGVRSLDEVDSATLEDYRDFLKHKYPKKGWKRFYNAFRRSTKQYLDVAWVAPKSIPNPTLAHSPYAFQSILAALRIEIDRIRAKLGRFKEDADKGRVLTFEDIGAFKKTDIIKLKMEQLDRLMADLKNECCSTQLKELVKKYGVSGATINTYAQRFKNGDTRFLKHPLRKLTADQITQLKHDFVDLQKKRSQKKGCRKLAQEYGVSVDAMRDYRKKFKSGTLRVKPEPLPFTKEDLIATVRHYLPHWPICGRPSARKESYYVYKERRGILLGVFERKGDADKFVDTHGGITVPVTRKLDRACLNPAEYILLAHSYSILCRYVKNLTAGPKELIKEYFPTVYDVTCVLMYWACLTGWNLEVMRSVSSHSLGLIFDNKDPMALFSADHKIIRGYKTRGQGEGKEKEFTHISEKQDPYGLYRVLSDFFELTKPVRPFLTGDEQNCILVGIGLTGLNSSFNPGLSMFGPSESCKTPFGFKSSMFFNKHGIYENEQRTLRVKTTDSMKLRTSYESMLTYLHVPAFIRRLYMGHSTIDTLMTSYGTESVSRGIRLERLRDLVEQLAEKSFKGKLLPYSQEKKPKTINNVIQLFTHLESTVFVCRDRTNPTWPEHEKYVGKGSICDYFEECLFCEQCIVTAESIPYLIRWRKEIREWQKEAGPADNSLAVMLYLKAIEEVLEQCQNRGKEWRSALIDGEMKELDQNFTAPPFWIGG